MLSSIVLRTQSDETLVQLASRGSEPAFETIVQRYRRPLLSYCRRLLLSDSRSEDVVQQTFLSAWTALGRQTEVRELKPWLYRITHNQAMSALRRPGWDFTELSESLLNRNPRDGELDGRIVMRETLAAVAALPGMQREVILRTAVEGRSYDEVATELGVSEESVRGLVYRARATLRAGFAVVAPEALVFWAAGLTRRCASSSWLPEALSGGGSAGGAAVVVKGAAVLASSAAVIGGTVGFVVKSRPPPPGSSGHAKLAHRVVSERAEPGSRAGGDLRIHEPLNGRQRAGPSGLAQRPMNPGARHLTLVAHVAGARATLGDERSEQRKSGTLGARPSGSSQSGSRAPSDPQTGSPMQGNVRAAGMPEEDVGQRSAPASTGATGTTGSANGSS